MIGKIAGYYRLSMEDKNVKEESSSITNQRLLVRRYMNEHKELSGHEYCEFYDDGYSGTTMNRPGMQALLEQVKQNKVSCVIVKDLSRFSRDYIEMGTYLEQIFPFVGIRFISISDHYDSDDYIGKTADIDVGFKNLLADFYCKDVSLKVRSSLGAKRKRGIYATGNTPFGYCKNKEHPNKLQIVSKEAEVVRAIFKLSLSDLNLTEICRTLNDEKILTPLEFKNLLKKQNRKELEQKRKLWQPGTVRAILLNESYIGSMVYNKTSRKEVGGSGVILKPRKEWIVLKNHHEPIVDQGIFEKVQKRFPIKDSVKRTPIEYALKGKVFCGFCNRSLKVMKLSGGKLFYYCGNHGLSSENECMADSMGNDDVEQIVLEQIREQLKRLTDLGEIRQNVTIQRQEQLQRKKGEMAGIEKAIAHLMEGKVKLLENYHDGGLSWEKYMECRRQIEQHIFQKRTEKEELDQQSKHYMGLIGNSGNGYDGFRQNAGFDALTAEIVDAFIDRIEIDCHKTVHIDWNCYIKGKEVEKKL